jgi:hypothetical protein
VASTVAVGTAAAMALTHAQRSMPHAIGAPRTWQAAHSADFVRDIGYG